MNLTDGPDVPASEQAWLPRLQPWAEPQVPIAEREHPDELVPPTGCPTACRIGECGDWPGCGGCCRCLGGCFAHYEQGQTAPHVWTGDPA